MIITLLTFLPFFTQEISQPLLSSLFFFLMLRRPPRSTLSSSSAASDVYKRQLSFWCYACDSYITNFACDMLRRELQDIKFPNQKPQRAYNIQSEEEKKEYFDSEEELDKKVTELANLVKQSKHFIAFTGAGISTSTGIPDFRSGVNTKLKTGPGGWEQLATKYKPTQEIHRISALCAVPSPAHMGLVALQEVGVLKFLISQNTDGLHRRSQFPPDKLAELHGNSNLEQCQKCGKKYLRDFNTASALLLTHSHDTGRICENPACKGSLNDTIINFGENLPKAELQAGLHHSAEADLCLCLGSSLRVQPAASMAENVGTKGKNLVIVNLQKTPLDKFAKIKINAYCDQVVQLLLKKLGIKEKVFKLLRRIQVSRISNNSLQVQGLDVDNLPYSLFNSIALKNQQENKKLKKEPFIFQNIKEEKLKLVLEFKGHYDEPEAIIPIDLQKLKQSQVFTLELDLELLKWEIKEI
eukprot:TRINITY_DN5996_c0_g1_i2.p1 TRINITY_DN5996_c0_g1~~TRINITY_DN5996_c0_g1_i2.p1  ORF type:complete len:469 (+),score=74.68 TRINITY_DN5996_c0_g1_i2:1-1407(+)